MKARRIKREIDANGNVLRRDLVFFGSYGLNSNGSAKFYNNLDKHDNFSEEKEGIADSLLVKLSILEGELWYQINVGWPLWDKHKDVYALDIYVNSVILEHPDVLRVNNFVSEAKKSPTSQFLTYYATFLIETKYGELSFEINQSI